MQDFRINIKSINIISIFYIKTYDCKHLLYTKQILSKV